MPLALLQHITDECWHPQTFGFVKNKTLLKQQWSRFDDIRELRFSCLVDEFLWGGANFRGFRHGFYWHDVWMLSKDESKCERCYSKVREWVYIGFEVRQNGQVEKWGRDAG